MIECRKTKNDQSEGRKTDALIKNQLELKVQPSKLLKARENVGDQVMIGFNKRRSDWLRGARVFVDKLQCE